MGSGDEEEPGRAERPWLPPGALLQRAAGPAVSRLHGEVRRDRRGRPAVRRRGARPAAQPSRPAARASAGRDRQARQPPAAPADGAAEPRLGLRPRRGHARRRAPGPRRRQPDACRSPSRRRRRPIPRHGRDAADRQFRLDARPADHGRGDERRHPGPHARALRRQGRDPGLHHPRLEGRPEPRALDRRRQAGQSRAASTICATSSTSRPTRRGGARARTSA